MGNGTVGGGIVGVVVGVPASYFIQPSWVRVKFTLADYLERFGDIVDNSELFPQVIMAMVVCGAIGAAIGTFVDKQSAQR